MTVVEGDPKSPFSIATTPKCRGGRYPSLWIVPIYPWSLPYNSPIINLSVKIKLFIIYNFVLFFKWFLSTRSFFFIPFSFILPWVHFFSFSLFVLSNSFFFFISTFLFHNHLSSFFSFFLFLFWLFLSFLSIFY